MSDRLFWVGGVGWLKRPGYAFLRESVVGRVGAGMRVFGVPGTLLAHWFLCLSLR